VARIFVGPFLNVVVPRKVKASVLLLISGWLSKIVVLNFKLTYHIWQNAIGQFIFQCCVLWTTNLKFTVAMAALQEDKKPTLVSHPFVVLLDTMDQLSRESNFIALYSAAMHTTT